MRRRVRFALVLSLAVLGASGCIVGFASIRGSGDVVAWTRTLRISIPYKQVMGVESRSLKGAAIE